MSRSRAKSTRAAGGKRRGFLERFQGLPPWLQAAAALVPAVIAVLAFLGLGPNDPGNQGPTDRISMDRYETRGDTLEVSGSYVDLDPDSETIVVLLVLDDPDATARFTPVEAVLTPDSAAPSDASEEREDGTWEVEIPFGQAGAYLIEADIIRARRGAGFSSEVRAELRDEGPEASVVVEGTAPVRVEP
jgi:hypothetical protein